MSSTDRRSVLRLPALTLALALMFALLLALAPSHTYAATTTVISDQASCLALRGDWRTNPSTCQVSQDITIRAGDTLIFQISAELWGVTNNGTLTNATSHFIITGSIINNAGATINAGAGGFSNFDASVNYGTINGSFQISHPFTNASTGQMNVQGRLLLGDVLTNQGTITIACGGTIGTVFNAGITGNPPQYADCTGPTVAVNQAAGQSDPAGSGPINFTAVFGENVTGFTASDVALSGTAGATSAVVSGSGSSYTIAVSGMTGYGTVIVSIPAGAVQDAAGNPSAASTSTDNTVLYMQSSTTTSFTTSANPARVGEPITFRATVTAASGATPDGTVTFLSGTTALGTATLVDGVASFTTSSLPVGNSVITARYEGTTQFNASVSAAGTQVVRAGSSTTLTLSASTSIFGEPITLTATVSAATSPSGSVTFYDGATALGTKALRTGAASVTVSTLAAGQHTLTAVYGGNPQLDGSVSPALIATVTPAQTAAALTVAPNPSVLGQTVTLTATVSVVAPGGGKPAGTVSFYDGTTLVGSKTLGANGLAIYSTSALAVGSHSLRAEYSGSANHSASASAPASLVVDQASTTTTLATSATNVVNGQKITLTATVAAVAPGKGTPTGSIIFRDGATELGSVALSNGRATKQVTLAVGSHDLVAEYVPADGSFSASSGTASVTVTPASTSVTLTTSGTPATFGRKVTFTATVKVSAPGVGIPTGTVVFRDGEIVLAEVPLVNGKATFATTTLARGTHPITASYSGDAGNSASVSSTVAQVVN